MTDTVTVERRGHVLLMGLNRAAKRNAFNLQMLSELARAYTTMDDDPEIRCGLLYAHGDHFTGGLALDEVGPAIASGQPVVPADCVDPIDLDNGRRRSTPVVCAVQGWCLTIGIELLLAADIRLAAVGTRMAQMEVSGVLRPFVE